MDKIVLAKSAEQRAQSKERRAKEKESNNTSSLYAVFLALCSMLRYRFFFFAGIFPYLLGQAIAYNIQNSFNRHYFWLGFLGIFFVLVGVELFNEYFDAREGGDRIFLKERPKIPHHFFLFALCSMLLAFIIGLYLAFQTGWPVLLFSCLGFLGAYFYVGPPIRWAYRGLGEIVIGLSYGPFMLLGSYYIQTQKIDASAFLASLICGLAIFSLAIINEIPDYIQDRLVGKRNIVVRLGREKSFKVFAFSLFCAFILLGLGILGKKIPYPAAAAFLILPLVINAIRRAGKSLEIPESFYPAVRTAILCYLVIVSSLGISYLVPLQLFLPTFIKRLLLTSDCLFRRHYIIIFLEY